MPVAMVDSNVLLADRLSRDQYHERGVAIVEGIDTSTLPDGRVTEMLLAEVLNPIQKLAGHDRAVETLALLESTPGVQLDETVKADATRGRELFSRYTAPEYTDAVTAAYMERQGIEYVYSFDDDFDVFDHVTRLNSATDPFA
jgi:predicted nucleic acid-binding protein